MPGEKHSSGHESVQDVWERKKREMEKHVRHARNYGASPQQIFTRFGTAVSVEKDGRRFNGYLLPPNILKLIFTR